MQAGKLRQQLSPFRADGDKPAYTSPVAYPTDEDSDFPKRLAGLAAMLGGRAADPLRVDQRAGRATTPTTTSPRT